MKAVLADRRSRPRLDLRAQARRHPLPRARAAAGVRLVSRNDQPERALLGGRRGARARARRRVRRRRRGRRARRRADELRGSRAGAALALRYVFDLLWLDGEDLRALPLHERKARAARGARAGGPLRFDAAPRRRHGEALFSEACREGLGGPDRQARRRPTAGALPRLAQAQVGAEQELVIGGYTAPKGSRRPSARCWSATTTTGAALRRQGRGPASRETLLAAR